MPDDFRSQYYEILQASVRENLPAAILDRFEVSSCLAFDDTKELYLLIDRQDGQKRLLRVTKGEFFSDAATEAGILHGLNHPAIAKVLEQWTEGSRSYLIREYFDGATLRARVRAQGVFTFDQIVDATLVLCDILTYIHGQHPPIIHRDIKPDNIILSKGEALKLIDFGIARKFLLGPTKDTRIIGTEPYMAPEQYGSEQTDGRADIYSLGVTMIFMATGQDGVQYLDKAFPCRALVPIIKKCTRTDRNQRFTCAAQLKRRLLRLKRRTRQKVLLCALALIVAVCAFAAGLTLGRELGFDEGVDWMMDTPTATIKRYTAEEGYEPISFESEEIGRAVRNALNKDIDATVYWMEASRRIDELLIYGTYIPHPSLNIQLTKTHRERDFVEYWTSDGFQIADRGDVSSLKDIHKFYFLRKLSLISQSLSDLSPLTGMKLTHIDLSNNFIGNLMPIKDMVTLRELALCQNPLNNLTPISRLLSLEALDISQTQVTDLRPLSTLTKLKHLELNFCDIKDLSPLAHLSRLQILGLRGVTPDSYDAIKSDSLLSLHVTDSGLDDASRLPELPRLEVLALSNNPILSVAALKRYGKLTTLKLDGTDITDLHGLEGLTHLSHLDISDTNVRDISAVAELPALKELVIGHTRVQDLTPLLSRTEPITVIYPDISAETEAQVKDAANIILYK